MPERFYFDHNATTPVSPEVFQAMAPVLTEVYGNASSIHSFGQQARKLLDRARREIAAMIGATAKEIVFTSGGTESDNTALFGFGRQGHVITTSAEHPAVLHASAQLPSVTVVPVDTNGLVNPEDIRRAIRPRTKLISVMHVNNELGVVQDIGAIARLCARSGRARLHVDAAQSVGKCEIDFGALDIDLMSLSAHKVYGPKGVGALVVSRRRGVHLTPLLFGGGQERGLRSGTVPTHQVVGMGAAFALAKAALPEETRRIARLQNRLWRGLESLGGVLRNGEEAHSVPHLLNVSFEGVEGESLLAAVRPQSAVPTGSA